MAYERKYKITKSTPDIYNFYTTKFKDPLDYKLFCTLFYELNKSISNLIITKSFEYRLPFRLGHLRILKRKLRLKVKDGKIDINKNMVDWEATFDYWEEKYGTREKKVLKTIKDKKRIYQLNEHTDGDIMSWYWDKDLCNIPNNTVYKFKPVKGGLMTDCYVGRLGLGEWIKLGKYDYYY